jgi:hypothetical protein
VKPALVEEGYNFVRIDEIAAYHQFDTLHPRRRSSPER